MTVRWGRMRGGLTLVYYFSFFGQQPQYILRSSFIFFSSFLLPRRSILFLAGDLAQLHLPVGMKKLNLSFTQVTGKAQLIKRVRVRRFPEHFLEKQVFASSRARFLIPHFLFFLSSPSLPQALSTSSCSPAECRP